MNERCLDLTPAAHVLMILFMAFRLFQSQRARTAAGLAALAVLLVFSVRCSDAPLISRQANRQVLSELFSTTE
jgi:hypothetical protein